jgi:hypothetical protein
MLIQTKAQNNPVCNCKCNYASHYKIDKYIFKADSIASKLKKQYNQNIKVIGARGHDAATLVFIVKVNGRNKGFNYDLMNKKKEMVEGAKFDRWLKTITTDSTFLHTVKQDREYVSHDASFFISFDYPNSRFTEICYSQLLTDIKRPLSKALMYYMDGFKYPYP